MSKERNYKGLAQGLLEGAELRPNEGKKEDPAHPAVYPTGNLPENPLSGPEKRIWDLVVRRFMAVFGEPAVKQSIRVNIEVNGRLFYLRGRRVLEEGWTRFYEPYIKSEEVLLPPLQKGEKVQLRKIVCEDKFTAPPARYNPSSLLKKMEDEGIGTKATRADIIETLYGRGYIADRRMVVTSLGFDIIEVLNKYCSNVISVELTRDLEERMEEIQKNREKRENVLLEAVDILKPALKGFKEREEIIGEVLSDAIKRAKMQERIIGSCPQCGTGNLMILFSRKTGKRFIGCTNYFKGLCKNSFPLPQRGTLKPMQKSCDACEWPLIEVHIKGRRPWRFCFNPNCPSREVREKRP